MWWAFLSGALSGAGIIASFLIMWHSVPSVRNGDWGFFILQFLVAVCIGVGGVLSLFASLEMSK